MNDTDKETPVEEHWPEGPPICPDCGCDMVPNGSCFQCNNCGSTSGCS